MNRRSMLLIGIVTLFLTAGVVASYADSLEKIEIIKISARDKQAILKMNDGKMRIIKTGDEINLAVTHRQRITTPEKDDKQAPKTSAQVGKAKVIEITADKIIWQRETKDGPEMVMMTLVKTEDRKLSGDENGAKSQKKDTQAVKPGGQSSATRTEIMIIKKAPEKQDSPLQHVDSSSNMGNADDKAAKKQGAGK